MDRLSWYQAGESTEEILIQAGNVGIYDGDLKQSTFEQGTASLTLQRLIWADSSDPDCRLILHHSLVEKIEKHHKSMFGRGGKIIVTLRPTPSGHSPGPVHNSGFNSLRLVFRQGGQDEFHKKYMEALSRQTWKRTSSSSSSGGSRSCTIYSGSTGAQSSQRSLQMGSNMEKRFSEQQNRINQTISQAFEDMSKLMEEAREMVNLSKSITERLRVNKKDERDAKEEEKEDDLQQQQFHRSLLGLGVSDPVMKSVFGSSAVDYEVMAKQISDLLVEFVEKNNGSITLPEAFCRVNRTLETELISPEDLLNACRRFDQISAELTLSSLEDGHYIISLRPPADPTVSVTVEP